MTDAVEHLWLIPLMPLLAAGLTALLPSTWRKTSATLALTAVGLAFVGACIAFAASVKGVTGTYSLRWFDVGESAVKVGWILNPLTAVMVVMVSFVSLLVFVYSVGYMGKDRNFARFFCFLSLFASAMLGLVISNSLLLLFICWELVGLASYLLIGFWYQKPAAAAAAKKAFIVTRIGDLAFLLGMVWLYSRTGTLLFYDEGQGCLEGKALFLLSMQRVGPFGLITLIGLLIFAGAVGKSGQVPLHVWLPDAMEGPTPVSALIHAATMVAAGVFLVVRMYPLMATQPALPPMSMLPQFTQGTPALEANAAEPMSVPIARGHSATLKVITWTGIITALLAASIAVAQNDIKRILAYSTVSQLGFMMAGIGLGGAGVGMFHLLTHAFFKALLFLGAGSVIHASHEEQDIRRMGGLRKAMPFTFATYAIGMLALSGFPLFFSGFWSKDAILHSALHGQESRLGFVLLCIAAFLTAFYMTRQVFYIFGGERKTTHIVHESPAIITIPLVLFAAIVVLLSLFGTPAWPWINAFLDREAARFEPQALYSHSVVVTLMVSSVIALGGIAAGAWLYRKTGTAPEWIQLRWPGTHTMLSRAWFVDELYEAGVVGPARWFAKSADWLDRTIIGGVIRACEMCGIAFAWISRMADELLVNQGFDKGCIRLVKSGKGVSRWQTENALMCLQTAAIGFVVLALLFLWGWSR